MVQGTERKAKYRPPERLTRQRRREHWLQRHERELEEHRAELERRMRALYSRLWKTLQRQ